VGGASLAVAPVGALTYHPGQSERVAVLAPEGGLVMSRLTAGLLTVTASSDGQRPEIGVARAFIGR